ncbi:helix-turn-helix domain-containing protein [Microbispora sp. SCL1-1]|uniref:helix-turn-helix domain-containing protein n=1 Tax=unclassified Microbispora TaxID=2614687 RepID=UPI00115712B4|nr:MULTISPECIES: helix-turn-helix domain-containing protein [unclassified Microbispora]NJP27203.1 helix-turn-helix domain-containing protein [Microbispora sp. CL1-1]TQS11537.1 helix-turn-helix domain-containing protein [Microbispora sp. SCL1-1]
MKDITLRDLQDLPPTLDLMTAARILGIGRTKAYELAKKDQFPVRTIRIGDLYRVSTSDLLRLLNGDVQ